MRILAVDPGETSGFAVFDVSEEQPVLLSTWEMRRDPLSKFVKEFLRILQAVKPALIVMEDYRIYADKADLHIGAHLKTAELLGALDALCILVIPPVSTARIAASKKGRWPDARLKEKFPKILKLTSPHVRDAAVIGLAYIEKELKWTPK